MEILAIRHHLFSAYIAASCFLVAPFAGAQSADTLLDEQLVDLATIQWMHGVQDCDSARLAPGYLEWQQVQYQKDTYIFRQNKCANYEAPFVYLFVGAQ